MGLKQNDTGRVPMPFVKCLLMNFPRDFFTCPNFGGQFSEGAFFIVGGSEI